MIERRKYPRIGTSIHADLVTQGSIFVQGSGNITNLSMGGMAFESDKNLDERAKIFFYLDLPFNLSVEISRKEYMGNRLKYAVKLDLLSSFDEFKLKKYIETHKNKERPKILPG